MTGPLIGSICTGYGGLDRAAHSVFGGELAWVADVDPDVSKVLAHRFPGVPNLGDITAVDWPQTQPVDVLTAGFPCQPVSAAGQRKGIEDERWLWDDICEAVGRMVTRPRLLVLENVPGLLSANGGDAMARVVQGLASLGYEFTYRLVRASDAGAPHRRERWFCLARLAADADIEHLGTHGRAAHADAACDGPHHAEPTGGGGAVPEDPDSAAWGERRVAASGQADGRGTRADAGRPGGAPAADTQGDRRHKRRPEPAGIVRGPDAAVSGDGIPADAAGDSRRIGHGDDVRTRRGKDGRGQTPRGSAAPDAECGGRDGRPQDAVREAEGGTTARRYSDAPVEWGPYGPAIARWESVLGRPAPRPTEPGKTGERLSPRFVEWMQGIPEGWVTDVPGLSRNAKLKILGNGVVPIQAELALWLLLSRAAMADREAAA